MGMPAYFCEGKFVSLREMSEDDTATVVSARNQSAVARWLVQWSPLTREQHLSWFRSHQQTDALFVFDLPDGSLIGSGSLQEFDWSRTTAYWGRIWSVERTRYAFAMLEGCYLVHLLAFELLGLKTLHGSTFPDNGASLRLANWLGYTQVGLRRQDYRTPNGSHDVIELSLQMAEFEEKRHVMEQLLYKNKPSPTWTEAARQFASSSRFAEPQGFFAGRSVSDCSGPTRYAVPRANERAGDEPSGGVHAASGRERA
jgi:RimJ/RimL family protein N-acetyltransferase